MVDLAVIGGGPAGLSAGLYGAKNDLETVVFDTDESWMHRAHLFNYPAVRSISGSEFLTVCRGQVRDRGGALAETAVTTVQRNDDDAFQIETADGDWYEARYLVLATGGDRSLAEDLGCAMTDDGVVEVDLNMETSIPNVYATGAVVREQKYQAVIAAGDGSTAALDIISKEKGEAYHDFDTPDDVPEF